MNISCFRLKLLVIVCTLLQAPVFSQTEDSRNQYLFPDFSEGVVKMKKGRQQKAIINYNTITGKMVYKQNGDLYNLVYTSLVDTVIIEKNRFVPVSNVFYEVISVKPVAVYIQHKGNLRTAGKPAGYGGTSELSSTSYISGVQLEGGYYNLQLPDEYIVKQEQFYWMKLDSTLLGFQTEKQFTRLIPSKEAELKKFMKDNKIKFTRTEDIVKSANYLHELLK